MLRRARWLPLARGPKAENSLLFYKTLSNAARLWRSCGSILAERGRQKMPKS